MKVEPQQIWKGESVVVIGGGPSLGGFDFSILHDVRTIGCNDAFHLGFPIVDICLFVDTWWWNQNKREINNHWTDSGIIFAAVNPSCYEEKVPWLHAYRKCTSGGFPTDGSIAMNNCSGAGAAHLAWALGAKEVFLLGCDCKFEKPAASRWHRHNPRPMKESAGGQFVKGFAHLEKERAKVAPDFKITNVVRGDSSDLDMFEKLEMDEFVSKTLPGIKERRYNGGIFTTSISETERTSLES